MEQITPTGRTRRGRRSADARHLQLAREAIAMVASGASARVVIAGVHLGEQSADAVRQAALVAGVRARVVRGATNSAAELVVERLT